MTKTNIKHNDESIESIRSVVKDINDVVGSTLGAKGRLVLTPHGISKDGIAALTNIQYNSSASKLIHAMFVEGINKTAKQSGDGRTTSTVIACDLISQGLDGRSLKDIELSIDDAKASLKKELKTIKDTSDVYRIAKVASSGDEGIASAISEALDNVGLDGLVTTALGSKDDIDIEYQDGLIFHSGYSSGFFATNPETMKCEFDKPYYLISGTKLNDINEVVPALEVSVGQGRPLVIMAQDYSSNFISAVIENRLKGKLPVALVKPYNFGDRRIEWLNDMAVSLNATFFDGAKNSILSTTINDLGTSQSITIEQNKTTIVNPHTNSTKLSSYVAKLNAQHDQEVSSYNQEKIKERIASLSGGLAMIMVGAASESLAKERLARCEDALNSSLHAIKHGYVSGGGAALFRAGIDSPMDTILENANLSPDEKSNFYRMASEGKGYDLVSGTASDDIIDSYITIENGLNNALAITKALLSINFILYDANPLDN